MPRLANSNYLFLRTYLCELWSTDQHRFGLISSQDESYLHQFFCPSVVLTDDEALVHRAQITKEDPSLPQCAGRALRHLANPKPDPKARVRVPVGVGSRNVRVVSAVHRPDPDIKRLARALMETHRHMLAMQLAQAQDDEDSATSVPTEPAA